MSGTRRDLRIVLVGAGSASFGMGTLGDLLTAGADLLEGSTVVLHDIDREALDSIAAALERVRPKGMRVESTTDASRALEGADYVVVSIEHGNRAETWKQDYYVPISHGSRQVYGENGGPGGAFHTWRQVGPLVDLARTMERSCPEAWLLNYSNPVPRLTWALDRATKIRNVGLCHGIGGALGALEQILGTSVADLELTSAGLNHFYWIVKIAAKREFAMPALGRHPARRVERGEDLLSAVRERGLEWAVAEERMFLAELLRIYGFLCYPSESHPAEYVSWADAYCPSVKYDFKAMAAKATELKRRVRETAAGREGPDWWVHPSGERAVHIMKEIEADAGAREYAVNMHNHGAIENLPSDCVVECPAVVGRSGISLERVGRLPEGIARLLRKEIVVQEAVVEAALSGEYHAALQALLLDETVPTPGIARAILDEMIELQGDLLPPFGRR
jgi:alpha-galactosidase